MKPQVFKNEGLAECSPFARLLFKGLWCMADRKGILKDSAKRIKAEIFPHDQPGRFGFPATVEILLVELAAQNLIKRYEVDGERYTWIPSFEKHARPHPKEPDEGYPPYSVEKHGQAENKTGDDATCLETEANNKAGEKHGEQEIIPASCASSPFPLKESPLMNVEVTKPHTHKPDFFTEKKTPEALASAFRSESSCLRNGQPVETVADLEKQFAELIRLGHDWDKIRAAIADPARDRFQYFSQFRTQHFPGKSVRAPPSTEERQKKILADLLARREQDRLDRERAVAAKDVRLPKPAK